MTTGKDLFNLGFKSGQWFKEALEHSSPHALEGDARLAYLRAMGPAARDSAIGGVYTVSNSWPMKSLFPALPALRSA